MCSDPDGFLSGVVRLWEKIKEKIENTPPPCWTSDDGSPFLPISLPSAEKSRKRTGPLTDITTYTQEYTRGRVGERERTNKRRKLTSCYHPIRKGSGVAPVTMHKRLTSFVSVVFFFFSFSFLLQIYISVDATRKCV